MNLTLLARALILGLTTGGYCLGFCLPVVAPPFFGARSASKAALRLVVFLSGRLVSYLGFGVLAGLVGTVLNNYHLFRAVGLPAVYFLLGILLISYGITSFNPFARFAICRLLQPKLNSNWFLFLLGILVGISPCPPFLLALVNVLDRAGVLNGLLFFFVFFFATTIYFLPLIPAGYLSRFEVIRTAARILATITGVYFIIIALRAFYH
ncbi:MAG: sulfite exporter TauE/SafE family protein [candidate division WOR-3 bacterium]|jgi:sulfite exporter TauE/SafE